MHLFNGFLGSYVATWGFAILGNSHINSNGEILSGLFLSGAQDEKSVGRYFRELVFSLSDLAHVCTGL